MRAKTVVVVAGSVFAVAYALWGGWAVLWTLLIAGFATMAGTILILLAALQAEKDKP